MKPAPFDYARTATLAEAIDVLGRDDAKVLAGGQSLGPMLNLRLVQPALLVDITRLPETTRVEETADGVLFGACTTHAAIEDGRVPDPTGGALAGIAANIAYRAVRNRGTIGGSLAHADPSADWISALSALGADVVVAGPDGGREIAVAAFLHGAFETALAPAEIIKAVRVPAVSADARWGAYKFCRKAGEFGEALCVVLRDPGRGVSRLCIGATDGVPVVLEGAAAEAVIDDPATADEVLARHGLADDLYHYQLHRVAVRRAVQQVR